MRQTVLCLILWGSLSALCSHLSASGSTVMIVSFAQQTNAPLRVNSLTQTLNDAISSVEVKNYSGKAIESYQIGWIETLPSGCAVTPMKAVITNGPVEEISIAPFATAANGPYRVWVKELLATAKSHKARLLYVQVGVTSVKFVDGSSWNYGPSEENLFDPEERNTLSAKCTSGQELGPSTRRGEELSPGTSSSEVGESESSKLDVNLLKAAGIAIPDCYYFCEHVFAPIYCTNNGNSCTATTCPNPHSCARQDCGIVC